MAKKKANSAKGKHKGTDFERDQSKALSLWWSRGLNPDVFWHNSGIPSRGAGRRVEQEFGDQHAIHPDGAWFASNVNVENKCYKQFDVLEIVDKPDKKEKLLLDHWEQCERDAEGSDRVPMVMAKRNFGKVFVVCNISLATRLQVKGVTFLDRHGRFVTLFLQEDLFKIDPTVFEDVLKKYQSDVASSKRLREEQKKREAWGAKERAHGEETPTQD